MCEWVHNVAASKWRSLELKSRICDRDRTKATSYNTPASRRAASATGVTLFVSSKWLSLEPGSRICDRGHSFEPSKWFSLEPKSRKCDRGHRNGRKRGTTTKDSIWGAYVSLKPNNQFW